MNNDKILYRVQDEVGRGPWRPGFSNRWIEPRTDHLNLIPYYNEFGPISTLEAPDKFIGCACFSVDQLRRWFTRKEYKKLLKYGFQSVMIDYDRIIKSSDIQCIFCRSKALFKDVKTFNLY